MLHPLFQKRNPKSLGSTAASDNDESEAAKAAAAASGAVSPGAAAGALEVKREPQDEEDDEPRDASSLVKVDQTDRWIDGQIDSLID